MAAKRNLVIEPFSTWAMGYFLPGDFNTIQAESVPAIAMRHQKAVQQILFAGLFQWSKNILLIPSPLQLHHVQDNLAAASMTPIGMPNCNHKHRAWAVT